MMGRERGHVHFRVPEVSRSRARLGGNPAMINFRTVPSRISRSTWSAESEGAYGPSRSSCCEWLTLSEVAVRFRCTVK